VAVTPGLTHAEHTELTARELEAGTEVIIDVERAPRSAQQGGPFG
jgi:hypothetical protein